MEFVVVTYTVDRKVRIDGQDAGFTNDTLLVEKGTHTFDLGEPYDYQPASVETIVAETNPVAPKKIEDFRPIKGVV